MLGHELRNPLAPILNALHVMRMPNVDEESIHAAARHRRTAGEAPRPPGRRPARRVPSDPRQDRAANRAPGSVIRDRTGRRSVQIACTQRPPARRSSAGARSGLQADPTRLQQILSNLLDNAIQVLEKSGSYIWLCERRMAKSSSGCATTGRGSARSCCLTSSICSPRETARWPAREGGLGIGLTMVRTLAEMHGGRVAAHSEGTGRGSEFLIVLPTATPEPAGLATDSLDPSPPASAGDSGPCRVLLVDDNVNGARILAEVLRTSGYLVDLAHDGPAALEIARVNHPEVVFLDIGLPGMNGYEVARRLRRQHGFENASPRGIHWLWPGS